MGKAPSGSNQNRWWKESTVYQVYPSSFKDTNGDGWGDVKGITSMLDYLKQLGIDIVWVSPIYKSPQADMGYDIADYTSIDPAYGTIADVDELIAELKKRNMKLMMDLVVNHTSDQHFWFLESRSSKINPKRDWYIWKPARRSPSGEPLPPNNWAMILGDANSAWTFDPETEEYYLSIFTPNQPDLNWENPEVRAAVWDVMNFWLERGVCGYRLDVINLISKDPAFPDAEENMGPEHDYHSGAKYFVNGPRMHEYLQEMNRKVLSKHDAMTVGEMPGVTDIDEVLRSVGTHAGELNMIFVFDIVQIDDAPGEGKFSIANWNVHDLRRILTKWQRAMIEKDGWNTVFIENHDQPRSVSRYTSDTNADRSYGAKLLAIMQATLAGTLYVYQGEELGMRNMPASWDLDTEYKDIASVNFWQNAQKLWANDPTKLQQAREAVCAKPATTPVPPSNGLLRRTPASVLRTSSLGCASTTTTRPSTRKPSSRTRRASSVSGRSVSRRDVSAENDDVFAYLRTGEPGRALVVLNFSDQEVGWEVPATMEVAKWMVGSYGEVGLAGVGKIRLRAWEGLLGRCKE